MDKRLRVGLFNDSFPPYIDGVIQVVTNYAARMQQNYCDVTVVTPNHPQAKDEYVFDVVRYPSFSAGKKIGYRVGNPFSPSAIRTLRDKNFDLLHIHAPFISSTMAARCNPGHKLPVVVTYHTKFEIDIKKRAGNIPLAVTTATAFVRHNLKMADEIWTVSKGCGESLRNIGYDGPYHVMENGTDFPYGKVSPALVDGLREKYNIRPDEFVFLFIGRMMWYKNVRIILDTLNILKQQGMPLRAFMIGSGYDLDDMRAYSEKIGLSQQVTFTGPIYDREYLRVFYSLADVFLFPSTYDTSGLVVREAAACDCPSLLVRDSCPAEGVSDGVDGFLAQENAQDCARILLDACSDRAKLAQVGAAAGKNLYVSWDTAVKRAHERYCEIIQNWQGHPSER